jgi:glycosyltransferase involved in cell wall biosynthesis
MSRRLRLSSWNGKPRAVFLRKVMPDPLNDQLELQLLGRHLDATLIGTGRKALRKYGTTTMIAFPLLRPPLMGGFVFYSLGAVLATLLTLGRCRSAIVCWSPYEAFATVALTRLVPKPFRPRVVIEIHGDWRTAARQYGHPARRVLAPVADHIAVWALRRADRVRVVSDWLKEMVQGTGFSGEIDKYLHFSNYGLFLGPPPCPLPRRPTVVFVGGLQQAKGPDVLVESWSLVAEKLPEAQLKIAGAGSMLRYLRLRIDDLGLNDSITLVGQLPHAQVRQLIDGSSCLVSPSRSEGLGLVVLEAMARGRAVIASATGGITEIVEHGKNGLLFCPGDSEALGEAILDLLSDTHRLEYLAKEGRRRVIKRNPGSEYEAGITRLGEWITSN